MENPYDRNGAGIDDTLSAEIVEAMESAFCDRNDDKNQKSISDKIGKIKIRKDLIQNASIEILSLLFGNFYPIKCEFDYLMDSFIYHGFSEFFDVVIEGEKVPEYDVKITVRDNGTPSISFTKE